MGDDFIVGCSFSRLKDFHNCPKLFQEKHILKTIPFEETDATRRGSALHKELENRIKFGHALGKETEHLEPVIKYLFDNWHTVLAEDELCFDNDWHRIDWFNRNLENGGPAMYRGKLDVLCFNDDRTKALVLDWKTGKVREDKEQLKQYAWLVMLAYPTAKEVVTGFVWVDHKQQDTLPADRDLAAKTEVEIHNQMLLISNAHRSNDWPPRNGPHCRWCPLNAGQCPFKRKY